MYLGSIRKNMTFSNLYLFQMQQVKTNVQNLIYFRSSFFFQTLGSLLTEFS